MNIAGRPRAVVVAVAQVVVERRFRGHHLRERLPFVHEARDPVADDHDHVAILEEIRLVADAAVPRDDVRAAFLQELRHRDVEHLVQSRDETVDAAAGVEAGSTG